MTSLRKMTFEVASPENRVVRESAIRRKFSQRIRRPAFFFGLFVNRRLQRFTRRYDADSDFFFCWLAIITVFQENGPLSHGHAWGSARKLQNAISFVVSTNFDDSVDMSGPTSCFQEWSARSRLETISGIQTIMSHIISPLGRR